MSTTWQALTNGRRFIGTGLWVGLVSFVGFPGTAWAQAPAAAPTATAVAAQPAESAKLVLGLLTNDADKYNVEFQRFDRMLPLYAQNRLQPVLIEERGLLNPASGNAESLYNLLKQCHVVHLTTTNEGASFDEKAQAHALVVGAALKRYVEAGGGLFLQPQPVRYPNTPDEQYWNRVLQPLGLEILHEGLADLTRRYDLPTAHVKEYWFTTAIQPHPTTEAVKRLYLPVYHFGPFPGVPAIRYTPDWTVIVSGEKEAKSYKSGLPGQPTYLNLEVPGTYTTAPPVAAVRNLGKGRVFCFPLAYVHTGMNSTNPLWPSVVETAGDKGAGLPSDSMKLQMTAYRWLGEPALTNPELGGYQPTPYKPIQFPPTVSFDNLSFTKPETLASTDYPDGRKPTIANLDANRGIAGLRSAYAGGKGTVAEFATAAKAAGLKFIIFGDPLENLTKETLEKLKADCKAVSDASFYACPGIEFTDGNGNRWACWTEKIQFPENTIRMRDQMCEFWDGKAIKYFGTYSEGNNWPGIALIDYKDFRSRGQHPENLWWFWHYLPLVYEKNKLVADNVSEWLSGMRDMRWNTPMVWNRIDDPADVSAAAKTWFASTPNLETAPASRGFQAAYVSQGPVILQWDAFNSQMESNWRFTCGAQRVRLRFAVTSDQGIAEVKVHDADRGLIRRFRGNGAKELSREFELVQDQQHYLVLEVVDAAGKRAFSRGILVYSYKRGWFRCGDNLNILGATGLLYHPDRLMMLEMCVPFRNGEDFSIQGWDRGSAMCPMPKVDSPEYIYTKEFGTYPERSKLHAVMGKVLDMGINSYQLIQATMHMDQLASQGEMPGAIGNIARDVGESEVFTRTHTMIAPMDRVDHYIIWNSRRRREGSADFRGSILWHEGEIRFKKDTTLRSEVPIPLADLRCPLEDGRDWGRTLVVTDATAGTRVLLYNGKDKVQTAGRLKPGGYAAQMPSIVGYNGFLAPAGSDFAYNSDIPGRMLVGLGRDGQQVKAGTVMTYRFAVGAFADYRGGNPVLEQTVRGFNFGGGFDGYPVVMKTGKAVDGVFFFTAAAEKNEAAFTLGPCSLMIDLPIKVQGVQNNGCVAVYSTVRPWFRFVPVQDNTAWFQEPIDKANEMWVGNIFMTDKPEVKITAVIDGIDAKRKPFVELHNPTDQSLTAKVWSPAGTPRFAGLTATVALPAGDSTFLQIDNHTLTPMPVKP